MSIAVQDRLLGVKCDLIASMRLPPRRMARHLQVTPPPTMRPFSGEFSTALILATLFPEKSPKPLKRASTCLSAVLRHCGLAGGLRLRRNRVFTLSGFFPKKSSKAIKTQTLIPQEFPKTLNMITAERLARYRLCLAPAVNNRQYHFAIRAMDFAKFVRLPDIAKAFGRQPE